MYGLPDQEETTYFKEELEKRFVKRSNPVPFGKAEVHKQRVLVD